MDRLLLGDIGREGRLSFPLSTYAAAYRMFGSHIGRQDKLSCQKRMPSPNANCRGSYSLWAAHLSLSCLAGCPKVNPTTVCKDSRGRFPLGIPDRAIQAGLPKGSLPSCCHLFRLLEGNPPPLLFANSNRGIPFGQHGLSCLSMRPPTSCLVDHRQTGQAMVQ